MKTWMQYAQEAIENGLIDAESLNEQAEQIEVEVESAARMDGREDAAEFGGASEAVVSAVE